MLPCFSKDFRHPGELNNNENVKQAAQITFGTKPLGVHTLIELTRQGFKNANVAVASGSTANGILQVDFDAGRYEFTQKSTITNHDGTQSNTTQRLRDEVSSRITAEKYHELIDLSNTVDSIENSYLRNGNK